MQTLNSQQWTSEKWEKYREFNDYEYLNNPDYLKDPEENDFNYYFVMFIVTLCLIALIIL